MKKTICVLCSLIMVITMISFSASAYDAQFCENEAYTSEEIAILNQKNAEAYNEYLSYKDMLTTNEEFSMMAMPVTTSYLIDVPNYTQEKNNWCGPACVRQTLAFHATKNGISLSNVPSQSTIATALGIYSSGGASSADMTTYINGFKNTLGFSNYTYSKCNYNNQSDKMEWLYSAMRLRMKNQSCAPILLFETGTSGGLQKYNNGNHIRHYNTISGVQEIVDYNSGNMMGRYIRRVDPHYSSDYRGVYYDPLGCVSESLALADTNGSNYVVIY